MKLEKKRMLAGRTLGVGRARITFNTERLSEIKEAITKQDIRDLVRDGAIIIREPKGRTAVQKRTSRRKAGSVRKKVKNSKAHYVVFVRKMRAYLRELRKQNTITREQFITLRKELRANHLKSKAMVKERLTQLGTQ